MSRRERESVDRAIPAPPGPRRLLASLALQNIGRRKTRTGLLVAAVAISSAIAFSGTVAMRSIEASIAVGFSRLGADLMVVAQDALTNITAALLTVEPTDRTVDADLFSGADFAGIGRASPQRTLRTDRSGFGRAGESVDLIGFDPGSDFTVQPWIVERLGRPLGPGDVILGAARAGAIGSELTLFDRTFRVYARLGRTGVGTHERGVFMPTDGLLQLGPAIRTATGQTPPMLERGKVSGFLIELAAGATEVQVRFALLSRVPGIKVIAAGSLLTGIRQGLTALLGGVLVLVAMTFVSTAAMVAVLFSAIVAERHGEFGLLKAIGARRSDIVGMTVFEAMLATGMGGALGVLVGMLTLRLFERSLVHHVGEIGIPFVWLDRWSVIAVALACIVAAALTGMVGACLPAWRVSRRDPYDLLHDGA